MDILTFALLCQLIEEILQKKMSLDNTKCIPGEGLLDLYGFVTKANPASVANLDTGQQN